MKTNSRPMSIGEVLRSLREEFSDVTISKIRFLESEGLIEPERSASGYRKFSANDVARLRYILRLQRDHFMPLKVIRRRLEDFEGEGAEYPNSKTPSHDKPDLNEVEGLQGGLSLTFEELLNASGLEFDELRELEEFGLIAPGSLDSGEFFYDEDDLQVAKLSSEFAKYGIQARHLRMYKNFAEKEAGMFEQVVAPSASAPKRNGAVDQHGRRQSLAELARLSRRLKQLMLKNCLEDAH